MDNAETLPYPDDGASAGLDEAVLLLDRQCLITTVVPRRAAGGGSEVGADEAAESVEETEDEAVNPEDSVNSIHHVLSNVAIGGGKPMALRR